MAYWLIVFVHNYYAPKSKEDSKDEPTHLLIKQNGKNIRLDRSDIIYAQADNNAVIINTPKTRYVAYRSLKSLEDQLDNKDFVRVHRSYLVRKDTIREFIPKPSGDGTLILDCGASVKVSRNYKPSLRADLAVL